MSNIDLDLLVKKSKGGVQAELVDRTREIVRVAAQNLCTQLKHAREGKFEYSKALPELRKNLDSFIDNENQLIEKYFPGSKEDGTAPKKRNNNDLFSTADIEHIATVVMLLLRLCQ